MKIIKSISILILVVSSVFSIRNVKTSEKRFYVGSTEQQLQKTTTPLINMNDGNSQILNACLTTAFTNKYETQQRDLWAKIEKVSSKTTELFQRAFWIDFFNNIKDELKDPKGVSQVCGVALASNLKSDADFRDAKIQKQIRDSLAETLQKVANLVASRQKTLITSSVSTHRGSPIVDSNVFSKLNTRTNLR